MRDARCKRNERVGGNGQQQFYILGMNILFVSDAV